VDDHPQATPPPSSTPGSNAWLWIVVVLGVVIFAAVGVLLFGA
jgi:hypothetical protein